MKFLRRLQIWSLRRSIPIIEQRIRLADDAASRGLPGWEWEANEHRERIKEVRRRIAVLEAV